MQVRLDDEASAYVKQVQDREGGSATQVASRLLRELQALQAGPEPQAARPPGKVEFVRPTARKKRAPKPARAPAPSMNGRCRHPLLRRIGDQCAACGATV